jgi:hypothetical protein
MPPAPRTAEREEERRLNLQTLTIASSASAVAAAVTSQLWIAGTWIAAALTPVLVALISEALHRPTERIVRTRTDRRTVAPAAEPPSSAAERLPSATGPVRVYRQPGSRMPRRRIAIGVVAATAAVAFVVAIVALTTVDLVSGGSVGKGSGRTTFFSTSGRADGDESRPATGDRTEPQRQEPAEEPPAEPPPTETAPEQPPSDTAPLPPPEAPPAPGEPAPQAVP